MTHLENGKHVLELNLVWNGQVAFTLDENMLPKKLQMLVMTLCQFTVRPKLS